MERLTNSLICVTLYYNNIRNLILLFNVSKDET
jgi:hypothetical protein